MSVVRSAGVGASLLLGGEFESLYCWTVWPDEARFQCRSVVEGQAKAALWGLAAYRHRVSAETGSEFHEWDGAVDGVRVCVVATPTEPIGSLEVDVISDPLAALQVLAEGQ